MLSSSISSRDGISLASCAISKRGHAPSSSLSSWLGCQCVRDSAFAIVTPRRAPHVAPVVGSACTARTGAWKVRSANQYIRV
jgi:hypothetical protein